MEDKKNGTSYKIVSTWIIKWLYLTLHDILVNQMVDINFNILIVKWCTEIKLKKIIQIIQQTIFCDIFSFTSEISSGGKN